MEIEGKVRYWLDNAEYDLKTAEIMDNTGRYAYTAFMCQQTAEKAIKALFLKIKNTEAPRSHNLSYLIGLLELSLDEKFNSLLAELTTYYLEGRYPTYKEKITQLIKGDKSKELLSKTKEFYKWLRSLIA